MNEGYWWRRLCLKDIRREVLLGVEPGLEGQTIFDGPWPTRETAAIHRAAGIPGVLMFESIMVDVGPIAAVEEPALQSVKAPVRTGRRHTKALDPDDEFLKALSEV
jgi:hypothetical protein